MTQPADEGAHVHQLEVHAEGEVIPGPDPAEAGERLADDDDAPAQPPQDLT